MYRFDRAMAVGGIGGTSHDIQELGIPFQSDIGRALEEIGISLEGTDTIEREFPNLPAFPPQSGPQAGISDGAVIYVGIFISNALANLIIEEFAKEFFSKKVQPAFENLWGKILRKEIPDRTVTARFDQWFDGSGVLVRVVSHCPKGGGPPDTALVSASHRRAVEWLRRNPVTHRVLTYEITHGEIPAAPELSEPI